MTGWKCYRVVYLLSHGIYVVCPGAGPTKAGETTRCEDLKKKRAATKTAEEEAAKRLRDAEEAAEKAKAEMGGAMEKRS
jgi:hypothetical protein